MSCSLSPHVFTIFLPIRLFPLKNWITQILYNWAKKDADRKIRQNSFFRKSYWKQVVTYKSIFPGRIWKPLSIRGSFLASLNEHWVLILSPSIIWQKNNKKSLDRLETSECQTDWSCGVRPELNFFLFLFWSFDLSFQ